MLGNGFQKSGNIKFIAVGRVRERVLVASLTCVKGETSEQYHDVVQELLSAPDFSSKITPGGRYHLVGDVNAINFTVDAEFRIYVVITLGNYPERIVFQMLNELVPRFKKDFHQISLTAGAGTLDGKVRSMFRTLCDEYDNPAEKDKLVGVIQEVEGVKKTMGRNIDSMLKGIDRSQDIEESSRRLQDQAQMFEVQATTLKRRELCRKWKTTLAMVCFLLVVLVIIIISMVGIPVLTPNATQPPVVGTMAPTLAPSVF